MPSQFPKFVVPLTLSLLVLCSTGCNQKQPEETASTKQDDTTETQTADSVTDDPAARLAGASWTQAAQSKTLTQAKAAMEQLYLLKPDQRFLNAISVQHQLLEGKAVSVKAKFHGKHWRVQADNVELGTLTKFPNFDEMYLLLKNNAAKLKSKISLKLEFDKRKPQKFENTSIVPNQLLATIEAADQALKNSNMKVSQLRDCASALTVLCTEQLDMMEIGDALTEKSLALVSIYEAESGDELPEEKCLLAEKTHYFAIARKMATKLAPNSAVRNYCLGNTDSLLAFAEKSANPLARLFALKLIANQRDSANWKAAVKRWYKPNDEASLPVLATYSAAAPEEALIPLAHHLMLGSEHEADAATKSAPLQVNSLDWTYKQYFESTDWMLKNTLMEFENKLPTATLQDSRWVDKGAVAKAFYRGFFYSGIYLLTQTYETLPSGWQQVEKFHHSLGYTGSEAVPLATVAWVKAKAQAGAFMPGAQAIGTHSDSPLADLTSLRSLGAPPLIDLYETLTTSRHASEQTGQLNRGMQLYQNLDSRPKTRWSLINVAERTIFAIKLARDTLKAAISAGVPMSIDGKILAAITQRNPGQLVELLKSPRTKLHEKLSLLSLLQRIPEVSETAIAAHYRQLAKDNPHNWETIASLTALLFTQKKYQEAQTIVEDWMSAQKNKFVFLDEVKARTTLARALHAQKQYAKALDKLGKAYESELFEPLAEKALLLAALGRNGEAISWATEVVKRQPSLPDSYVLLAGLFWKDKNFKEASMVLNRGKRVLSRQVWQRQIGPLFANCFASDKTGCSKALACLKDDGFANAECVGKLAHAAYLADKAKLAFEILSTVQVTDEQVPDMLVCGYRYLKRWKGKNEALNWLKEQVPIAARPSLAPYAFISGQYELLWNFTSDPSDEVQQEKLWLIQAAAALQDGVNSKTSISKIRQKVTARQSSLSDLVKHLLSLPTVELYSRKLTPEEICRAGFYMGWRELCSGSNLYESTDWLRLALHTNRPEQQEYQWSHRWLSDVTDTLSRIPAQTVSGTMATVKVVAPSSKDWNAERRFTLTR